MKAYYEALRDYDEALKYAEDDLRAQGLFNKGNVYFDTEQYPDAIEAYKEVLRSTPTTKTPSTTSSWRCRNFLSRIRAKSRKRTIKKVLRSRSRNSSKTTGTARRAERTRSATAGQRRAAGRTARPTRPAAKRPAGRPGRGTGARTASATAATSDRADYSGAGPAAT